jgi:hypothetical protein
VSQLELSAAAAMIDQVTARLATTVAQLDLMGTPGSDQQTQMSLVGGRSHPVAPQLALQATADGAAGEWTGLTAASCTCRPQSSSAAK